MSIASAADPTPCVLTLSTIHIGTTGILFYRSFTFGTLMSSKLVDPVFVQLLLCLSTSLTHMPGGLTLAAKVSFAFSTLHLSLLAFIHFLTSWVRTELHILLSRYLIVLHESEKFLIRV